MATEFVGIELELRGEEGVYKDLQRIQSLMNSLNGRHKVDAGLQDARRQVVAYRGELEKLKRTQDQLVKAGYSKVAEGMNADIEAVKNNMKDAQQAIRIFQQGIRESGRTFGQTMTSIAARSKQIGSSMLTLGNTLSRVTSPLNRLTTGILYGAGYKALNMLTSGFSGAFERYDTMNNYTKSLKALGLQAEQTFKVFENQDKPMTAIENLNESVLGLPTGLDEIVAAQKVYAGATGEMVKSTKTAIAANNTFLASGTNAREQRFIQRYLASLASGAELTTTQWQSMARIAPLAMRSVANELGYTGDKYQDFIKDVSSGTIAGQEFLNTFIEVGTNGKVQAAANVMKTTWAGLSANIQNATKRMGEGVLKALDDAFVSYNGRNFVQNLLGFDAEGNEIGGGIKHWINDISSSIQDWIRANPDKIMDFFNELKSIDVKGLLKGIAEGMKDMATAIRGLVGLVGGLGNLEGLGKLFVHLNMAGKAFTVAGGLIKAASPLVGLIGALLSKVGKIGLFGRIAEIFGGIGGKLFGAKKAKDIADAAGSLGKASGGLVSMAKNIGLFAGSIAAIGGAGFVAFRSFKTIVKDLHEAIAEINSFSTGEIQSAQNILFAMGAAMTAFVTASDAIGLAVGSLGAIGEFPAVIGGVVAAIVGALGAVVATEVMTVFKNFELATKALKQGLENVSELGNIKFNKSKVEDALSTMKEIMATFDASYDEGGSAKEGGQTHADWSSNAAKFKVITQNISDAVKGIKNTMNELNALPELSEAEITSATKKVENVIEAMKEIAGALNLKFDTGLLDFLGGGTTITEGSTGRAGSIIENIRQSIATIKETISDLKALEDIGELDAAVENAKTVGEKMGEIFTALNNAFGQEFVTDYDSSFTKTTNEGVTDDQVKKSSKLQQLLESYKATIDSIRGIYESLVGGEGDTELDLGKFNDVMDNLTGDEGILAQLQEMYNGLISESEGFGGETDVDLAGIMSGFAQAIGSLKGAVTTLSEIGQIEFEGDGGMAGVVQSIKQMITDLTNAFSEESMGALTASIEAFKVQIETIKTTIESLGGEEGGIMLNIVIIPDITGDEETVQMLEDAHDSIETARDAIKNLSESIHLSFPISVSLPGLEGAIQSMYSAASRLRAARSALSAAGYSTGGLITGTGAQYFASGGSVRARSFPGRPMGTDTVPIWATPGEYMMKKKAVDFFGVSFMRRVNNLDIRGAMNTLMAKAGSMANVGRQTVINNTYNNNQKVVQNINTNNSDFAYRSASRFVGAF